jgi:hypothetical protein
VNRCASAPCRDRPGGLKAQEPGSGSVGWGMACWACWRCVLVPSLLVCASCAASTHQPLPTSIGSTARTSESAPTRTDGTPQVCPATQPTDGTFPFPAGPASMMVPDAPGSGLVCRFAGFNEPRPAKTLDSSAELTGADLAELVAALNALPDDWPRGPANCPADSGATDLIIFSYPQIEPIHVSLKLTGCASATNGAHSVVFLGSAAGPGESVLKQLASVVGPPGH